MFFSPVCVSVFFPLSLKTWEFNPENVSPHMISSYMRCACQGHMTAAGEVCVCVGSPPCGHPHWSIKTRKKWETKKVRLDLKTLVVWQPADPHCTMRTLCSGRHCCFTATQPEALNTQKEFENDELQPDLKKKWMKERLLMGMRPGFSKEPASKASHWLGGVAANPKQVPLVLC